MLIESVIACFSLRSIGSFCLQKEGILLLLGKATYISCLQGFLKLIIATVTLQRFKSLEIQIYALKITSVQKRQIQTKRESCQLKKVRYLQGIQQVQILSCQILEQIACQMLQKRPVILKKPSLRRLVAYLDYQYLLALLKLLLAIKSFQNQLLYSILDQATLAYLY